MTEEQDSGTKLVKLVELAQKHAGHFMGLDGKAYVKMGNKDHCEVYPVNSSSYENWLSTINYKAFGEVASNKLKSEAVQHIEGVNRICGKVHDVGFRAMGNGTSIEIDLGDDEWHSVFINQYGWEVDKHQNYLYRSKSIKPLPYPLTAYDEQNWPTKLFDLSSSQARLVTGWLIGCFMPKGPYPILVLQGEQGSGKSTLASMLRSLVDPAKADKTSLPTSERDLYVQAHNNYVLSFDNQRTLRKWKSDWLCRMATGGGYSTRRLYTNSEEEVFDLTRPIVLNGITQIADQPDLIDRSIVINLPTIERAQRKTEGELWAAFNELRPRIFGQICDLLASILAQDENQITDLPRMADFAKFVLRAEKKLGWLEGTFIDDMKANRLEALEQFNEYDILLSYLLEFAELNREADQVFLGSPTDLFFILAGNLPSKAQRSSFPSDPAALSKRLNGLKPVLREKGIRISDKKTDGKRLKLIEWMEE